MGGIGVRWPERDLTHMPLSPKELEYIEGDEQERAGVTRWAPFSALRNSSTRCEVAALLVGMIPAAPVHIATDSQSCLDRACDFNNAISQEEMRTRRAGLPVSTAQENLLTALPCSNGTCALSDSGTCLGSAS